MKKKTIICFAALIIAAIVSVTVVSCKKDKDEVVKATNSEARALLNRIEAFQTLRDAVNSGEKVDGSMTVEEMRQALDLVSNYEHSEHMTYCLNTVVDTLHIAMPTVDNDGYVSSVDVVETYNAFEIALEKCMFGVKDGMDVPSYFSIVMPKAGAKNDDDIDVVFTRGEAEEFPGYDYLRPFIEGDDYKWGFGLGHCFGDSSLRITDAAMELTRILKFCPDDQHQGLSYLPVNVEYAKYKSVDVNYGILHDYQYYEDTFSNCSIAWLFYAWGHYDFDNEPCILHDEMNCYYNDFRRIMILPNSPLHFGVNTNSPYFECTIDSQFFDIVNNNGDGAELRVHLATIKYCTLLWSETPGGD